MVCSHWGEEEQQDNTQEGGEGRAIFREFHAIRKRYLPGPQHGEAELVRAIWPGLVPHIRSSTMLIARAILARVRAPRLSPREIQDQVDVTRAAVLTAAYAIAREEADGLSSKSYGQLEKEIAALKPLARKRRAQTAINDQVSVTAAAAVARGVSIASHVRCREPNTAAASTACNRIYEEPDDTVEL